MIEIKNILAYNQASNRLRAGYYWQNDAKERRESDSLAQFTFRTHAYLDSSANLENLLQAAYDHGCELLVFSPRRIQVLGDNARVEAMANQAWPTAWCESVMSDRRNDHYSSLNRSHDISDEGGWAGITHYERPFGVNDHAGVYDVKTGERITNRRVVIERAWQRGFACRRGRPLNFARIRDSGTREELREAESLYDRFFSSRSKSDVSRKIQSVYNSTVRYHCWPGSW
jgi:hypothetical protein